MKKYTFQFTKKDIREICLKVLWERGILKRKSLLLLLAAAIMECVLLPETVPFIMILFLVLAFMATVPYYSSLKRRLCWMTQTVWIENGMLKQDVEGDCYAIPCSSLTEIRTTRHFLMLGYFQDPDTVRWYPIPLRVFVDTQEREQLVKAVRNSQVQNNTEAPASDEEETFIQELETQEIETQELEEPDNPFSGEEGQEYFSRTFMVGKIEWIKIMAEATEIFRTRIPGKWKRSRLIRITLAAVILLFLSWVTWCLPYAREKTGFWVCVAAIIFIEMLRNFLENPEKEIRRQISKNKGNQNQGWEGVRRLAITDRGIGQSVSGRSSAVIPWDNLLCMVKGETGLFFYQKDEGYFIVLPKGDIESREQAESLIELCREKGVATFTGKRVKYVPGWFINLLTVIVVGYMIVTLMPLFRMTMGGYSPDSVPFEEQVDVLRSLGFTIPEDMAESLQDDMEEYEMTTYVESEPYTWLLSMIAWSDYYEEWADLSQEEIGIFWFDFEGWDISTNYIMVLEGMRELAAGSILDGVENIQEDIGNMDWENGTGTITVSLEWQGQEYSWEMDVNNDWIDSKVLGIYNGLLQKEGVPERFYTTWDNGQGAFVFYCTEEWAKDFEKATGLELEDDTVKPHAMACSTMPQIGSSQFYCSIDMKLYKVI